MQVYRYPHYGFQRPGTLRYEFGGHAYGGFRGLGDGGPAATAAAVAMVPEPRALPVRARRGMSRAAYARAMTFNARQAQANAIAAAALGNPFTAASQRAAAVAMKTRAAQAMTFSGFGAEASDVDIPIEEVAPEHVTGRPLEHPGQGRGVGLARVKEWWTTRTPGQKAATVGAGVGLAWAVGLL